MFNRKSIIFLSILIFTFISCIQAYQQIVDESGHSPFRKIAEELTITVVNIEVKWDINESNYSTKLPFSSEFFKFFFQEPPQGKRKSIGYGSGFMFRQIGQEVYIITNNHVIDRGEDGVITITLPDETKHNAEIVGRDEKTDVAVLKIKLEEDREVPLAPLGNSDSLFVGDWVIAIGNPFSDNLKGTLTVGIVSAKGRANLQFGENSPIYQDYIQTDAAINPGNSGGPLVDINGKVIGVNSAISTVSGGSIGIGFAIPINIVKNSVEDIIEKGYVERAYLGIFPQKITSALKKGLGLPSLEGVLIGRVLNDTPASEAGLKKGDVIIEFNGKPITNLSKFRLIVADSNVGDKVKIKIIREGKILTKRAVLTSFPETQITKKTKKEETTTDWLGIKVKSVYSDFAKKLNINKKEGVVVSKISYNSPAYDSQLRVGDVILEVNDERIKDVDDFNIVIDKSAKEKDSVLFYVFSGNDIYRYIAVDIP